MSNESRSLPSLPLSVPDAILQRRAIRHYKPDPIPPDILDRILDLAIAAPSSSNLQDWRAVLVESDAQKAALSQAANGQKQVREAPIVFVFLGDADAWKEDLSPIFEKGIANGLWTPERVEHMRVGIPKFQAELGEKTREYAVKNAVIAATHLVLAAESFGLSSGFMNGWSEPAVKEVLGIADRPSLAVALLIPMGYRTETPPSPGREPRSHFFSRDRFGTPL